MTFEAKLGAFIAIFGVFLNSTLDDLLKPAAKAKTK